MENTEEKKTDKICCPCALSDRAPFIGTKIELFFSSDNATKANLNSKTLAGIKLTGGFTLRQLL